MAEVAAEEEAVEAAEYLEEEAVAEAVAEAEEVMLLPPGSSSSCRNLSIVSMQAVHPWACRVESLLVVCQNW